MADPVEPKIERNITASRLDDELVLPDLESKKKQTSQPDLQESEIASGELQETSFSFNVKKDSSVDEYTEINSQTKVTNSGTEKNLGISLSENTLSTPKKQEVELDLPPTILDKLVSFFADKLKALEKLLLGKKELEIDSPTIKSKTKKKKKKKGYHDQSTELSEDELEEISTDRTL